MAGTKAGGIKARQTNISRYGKDFYTKIGAKGGKISKTGGFAYGDNGQKFGAIGGRLSRRGRVIKIGQPLTSKEVNTMLRCCGQIVTELAGRGEISNDSAKINSLLTTAYAYMMNDHWEYIFKGWACDTVGVEWETVLSGWCKYYRDRIVAGEFGEDDNSDYKAIRNLCNAYHAATGRKVSIKKE